MGGQQLDELRLVLDRALLDQLADQVLALGLAELLRRHRLLQEPAEQARGRRACGWRPAPTPGCAGRRPPTAATSWPRWAGRQCRKMASGAARGHQVVVDREPLEGAPAGLGLGLLAHRGPHVGVDHIGPGHGLARPGRRPRARRRARCSRSRSVADSSKPGGRGDPHLHAHRSGGQGQRPAHVVAVADVGDHPPVEGPELLADGQQVGQGLHGVAGVGEQVDHRNLVDRGHPLDLGVLEDPGPDGRVVAGQRPGRRPRRSRGRRGRPPRRRMVTGWPPSCTTAISIELRVRAEGFSNTRAMPRPASTGSSCGRWARSSTSQQLVGAEIVDLQQVPHAGVLQLGRGRPRPARPTGWPPPRRSPRRSRAAAGRTAPWSA